MSLTRTQRRAISYLLDGPAVDLNGVFESSSLQEHPPQLHKAHRLRTQAEC